MKYREKSEVIEQIITYSENAPLSSSEQVLIPGNRVVLNERIFTNVKVKNEIINLLKKLLEKKLPSKILSEILGKIVILPDEVGLPFISRSTIIINRVALDYKTKIVKPGALWSEEYVPEMTLFVTALIATKARIPDAEKIGIEKPEDVILKIENVLEAKNGSFYLQLGGHETIGKGFVKMISW